MIIFYDKVTNGFYPEWHPLVNDKMVEITDERHAELIESGKEIKSDKNGFPIAVERARETIEQQRASMVMSNAKARLKLIKLGLFDAIDKAIMAMPRNEPIYVLWEYGADFHRTNEHLTAFCTDTLKMKAEDIDALFI